jgi:predicted  nucleic acid-binding Zn-ribbon protein
MSREPSNTCPDIDIAIEMAKDINTQLEECDDCSHLVTNINYLIDYFEDLRKANEDIRQWGQDNENEVNDLNHEICELREKLRDCDSCIDDLDEECGKLQSEVYKLQDKLSVEGVNILESDVK